MSICRAHRRDKSNALILAMLLLDLNATETWCRREWHQPELRQCSEAGARSWECIVLMQRLQLRSDFDSNPIRPQFDYVTTIRRPMLRSVAGCCTTAKINRPVWLALASYVSATLATVDKQSNGCQTAVESKYESKSFRSRIEVEPQW